jgi:hypothetical protein
MVRIVLAGGDLVFCSHHAREYDTKLRQIAVEIVSAEEKASAAD